MIKKRMKSRLLVLILIVILLGSSITGCTKEVSGTKTVMDKNYVYKAEYIEHPQELRNIGRLKAGNDRIYVQGYNYKKGFCYTILSVRLDGTESKFIYEQDPKDVTDVSAFAVDEEGNLCFLETKFKMNTKDSENVQYKNTTLLRKVDEDGNEVFNIELKDGEEINCSDMMFDKDGNIILVCSNGLKVFDRDGKSKISVNLSEGNIENALISDSGKIFIAGYSQDYSKKELREFLVKEEKFSEPLESDDTAFSNASLFSSFGYDLLLNDGINIYGYRIDTKEKTKLLNWVDSDVNGTIVNNLVQLPDGRIAYIIEDYMKNPAKTEIAVLTKVAPENVEEKTVLTLAITNSDVMQMISGVLDFNKKNDKYRIAIKDYSVYNTDDDFLAGSKKLNMDIISGEIPDLLCLSDSSAYQNFVSKGLLTDFNGLMKKDKDFNRDEYLENIFDALEEDGKLYSLTPYFQTFSIVGKTSNVGKEMGWKLEDLKKMLDSKPKETQLFENMTRSQIMYYFNYLSMPSMVDYNKGICDLDTQEFRDILEFAKLFPEEQEDNEKYDSTQTIYKDNKVLLQEIYLHEFEELHRLQKVTFGEDITFIGFPSSNNNGSAFRPVLQFAISSKSRETEAAWEFVKSFLSDSFQDELSWEWPVKLSSLEKRKEKAKKPQVQTYTDENGKTEVYEETYTDNGKDVKLGGVTDEECDKVMDLLKSLTMVMRYDEKISNIIEEESSAYFAEQKSVEEVTKLIQNRVQTYLSERQ